MTENKCPKCGADIRIENDSWINYECDSVKQIYPFAMFERSTLCRDRQIAALEERLAAWRASRVGWDEYWETSADPGIRKIIQKLRDLEEI